MKTAALTGATLDWAVAKAEGHESRIRPFGPLFGATQYRQATEKGWAYKPSTDWAHGGPIIEREKIELAWWHSSQAWQASQPLLGRWSAADGEFIGDSHFPREGPTPLVAAMRCFVASKLGDEVEVPSQLQ